MESELYDGFKQSINQFVTATVDQKQYLFAVREFNQFTMAVSVFTLIYLGLRIFQLSLGSLAVFLFAVFCLGPKISNLNDMLYSLETDLPHMVRTQQFIRRLKYYSEDGDDRSVQFVDSVVFNDVSFNYAAGDECVLNGVSFEVSCVEFVGQSGAGKSTIVSLLARLYEPDEGEILADGTPIREFDISEWRDRISVGR